MGILSLNIDQSAFLKQGLEKIFKGFDLIAEGITDLKHCYDVFYMGKDSANKEETVITGIGDKVAALAIKHVAGDTTSGGYCLKVVQDILDSAGIVTQRVDGAYQFAGIAMKSSSFAANYKEVGNLTPLKDLPYGSILVFNRVLPEHKWGHIEIKVPDTQGNPKDLQDWVSDYIQEERATYAGHGPMAIYVPKN